MSDIRGIEKPAVDDCIAFLRERILALPQKEWATTALDATHAFAKRTGAYKTVHYQKLHTLFLEEINSKLPQENTGESMGLEMRSIRKIGDLFSVDTPHGVLRIPAFELFDNHLFQRRVFSSFGVIVHAVKQKSWLGLLKDLMARVPAEDSRDDLSAINDAIEQFLAGASDDDPAFMRKGVPVIHEGYFRFRLGDLVRFARSGFDRSITRPEVIIALRENGAVPRVVAGVRCWEIPQEAYDTQSLRGAGSGEDDAIVA